MSVTVSRASPRCPEAVALLQASHASMQALYDDQDNHALSLDALCRDEVLFFLASIDRAVVGTAALMRCTGYGEVKSLYVHPDARGHGAARALVSRLIDEAALLGLPFLKLETGTRNDAALALYSSMGFETCGPFGAYPDAPVSVFMERALSTTGLHRLVGDGELRGVLALMQRAFAFMDGVIDPPSSLHRMGLAELADTARTCELWVIGQSPVACVVLTPQPDTLYLGKLAVEPDLQGRGLARQMVELAMQRARALGLPSVTLQTRVELTDNHATFRRLGFVETGRTAHPGYDRPTSITYKRAT